MESVIFRAKSGFSEHTKCNTRIVAEESQNGIEPGECQDWRGRSIAIPPVAPTLLNCSIIELNYELHVKVEYKFFNDFF